MSDDIQREQRSKRLYDETVKIEKKLKIAKQYGLRFHDKVVREPHRLAKHNATNCGNSNCVMCMNPRKARGEKTIQEQRFEQIKTREELASPLDE